MLNNDTNYQMVNSQSGFDALVKQIDNEKELAVDLEADSLFHFQEKVCLIQIGTRSGCFIVDPFGIDDISALGPIFANPDIKKIFHGADYDIRSLYRDFRIRISNLFDTELAGRLIGLKSTGLNALLKNKLNVDLDKRFQKKDWSQRPLPDEMVSYAALDVLYLIDLAEDLENELAAKGRLEWLKEECALLCQVRPNIVADDPLFLKFKGAGRLNKQALGILEALLQLRFRLAQKKDKPLFKIIGNDPIMKLAIQKPNDIEDLNALKVLSAKQVGMYGKAIVNTINSVLRMPKSELPKYPIKRIAHKDIAQPHMVKALKAWRDAKAEKLSIDPALIVNKTLMNSIAVQYPLDEKRLSGIEGIKKWQVKAFGRDIINIINNREL